MFYVRIFINISYEKGFVKRKTIKIQNKVKNEVKFFITELNLKEYTDRLKKENNSWLHTNTVVHRITGSKISFKQEKIWVFQLD